MITNVILWKLRKVVYGLNDASRIWFFTVRKELLSSNCIQSTIDKAIFRWYENSKLAGLFVLHVDDFFYAGTKSFITNVIDKICLKFQIGSQGTNCFKYIGLEITHDNDSITLAQNEYSILVNEIPITITRMMHKRDEVSCLEKKQLRSLIGKLNWIANQTRPDLSFDVLQ